MLVSLVSRVGLQSWSTSRGGSIRLLGRVNRFAEGKICPRLHNPQPRFAEAAAVAAAGRRSDGHSGETSPPKGSARCPLSGYRLRFLRRSLELGENGFEALDSCSTDLLRPPSDRNDFKICSSPHIKEDFDRWDLPGNAPVAGDGQG
ncbi:hypothetical protein GQ457_03G019140 [Hibiscus cannabinus]